MKKLNGKEKKLYQMAEKHFETHKQNMEHHQFSGVYKQQQRFENTNQKILKISI